MKTANKIKIAILFLSLFITCSTYAANVMLVQCPATVPGIQNGLIDVYVGVSDVSGIFGSSFVLNFDKNYLSAQNAQQDSFLGSDVVYFNNLDNAAGKVSIGITKKAGQQNASGSGNLVKITFKILVNVSSQVTVPFTLTEVTAVNSTGGAVTLQTQNGSTLLTPQQAGQVTIFVAASPEAGGTVSGSGNYTAGQTVAVKAVSSTGYAFLNWKENGTIVSTNSLYTFTASVNRSLVANFQSTANTGVLILGNASAAVNDSVIIPLSSLNLPSIGAITIKIKFDTLALSFGRALNWDSQLGGALAGVSKNIISLVWDGISGANLSANKIADLKFLYKGPASPTYITFETSTEIADVGGNILSPLLVNGFITSGVGVKGQVVYANTAQTPLKGVKVFLYIGTIPTDSVLTDNSGNYSFDGKANGTYTLRLSYTGTWGGVSSTDALFLRQYIASIRTLDPLQILAADVNQSSSVSSVDALLIRKRIAYPDSVFKAGDWVFENPTISLSGSSLVQNIRGLCLGDVNSSYVPTVAKTNIIKPFNQSGYCNIKENGIIEIPVYSDVNMELAALTLGINYSSGEYEIVGVDSKLKGLSANAADGKIKFAWDDLIPVNVNAGEALLTIKLKDKSGNGAVALSGFSYDADCELADLKGNLYNASLSMPVQKSTAPNEFKLNQNYPNPFNPTTTVSFSLPSKCSVKLNLFNSLGQIVKELKNGIVEAGSYNVNLNAGELPSGIYLYSITAEDLNSGAVYKNVKKLILLK